jgi:hypothetical protein
LKLLEKLLEMQNSVDKFVKDGKNLSDKYNYVSSDNVLDTLRPKMNELKLLLIPEIKDAKLTDGQTKSGTTRYMTELFLSFIWVDCETGEQREIPFYSQGVDLAGEKGVGKALTYAEKYFFMKFFHIGTSKDDPDNDNHTASGEKKQKGTQAEKEKSEYFRKAISQMLNELCQNDAEKIKASMIVFTKSDSRQYAGVDNVNKITDAALPVLYAKIKDKYKTKTGHDFVLVNDDEAGDADVS